MLELESLICVSHFLCLINFIVKQLLLLCNSNRVILLAPSASSLRLHRNSLDISQDHDALIEGNAWHLDTAHAYNFFPGTNR